MEESKEKSWKSIGIEIFKGKGDKRYKFWLTVS